MYTRILYATDLSSDHYPMCQQALEIALKFNATLYLLHVLETPSSLQLAQGLGFAEFDSPAPVKEDAKAVLQTLGDALNISTTQQFVEIGAIKTHVLEKIEALDCNLLIIGSHGKQNLPTLLSNTARSLVESAPCDVLTLRG